MSLQKLLVEYPNFSARRVRRLAKQLAMLDKIDPVAHPEAKGIAADLMEAALLSARIEAQMNDDRPIEPEDIDIPRQPELLPVVIPLEGA